MFPKMYVWYGPTWLEKLHVSRSEVVEYSLKLPFQTVEQNAPKTCERFSLKTDLVTDRKGLAFLKLLRDGFALSIDK